MAGLTLYKSGKTVINYTIRRNAKEGIALKKKWISLALCVLLVMNLATPLASAEDEVYFIAAGSYVLPLADETMPFRYDGYLYVNSSIFTGLVWKTLDVGCVPANANQPLILYAGNDRSLMFEPGAGYAYDLSGDKYYPGAIERDGEVYVSIYMVAKYFGLEQSTVSDVAHGKLLWIRKPGFGLSKTEFANAAVYSMEERYAEYQKNKQTAASQGSGSLVDPDDPTNKRNIYLCLQADSMTATLLDVLERRGSQAAFFCDAAFLESQHDLLRRMVAEGHTVGLLAEGNHGTLTVEQQLSAGNEALYRATCTKTRLAYVENGTEEITKAAADAGYRCLEPKLDRSAYSLRSESNADTLLQRVAARQEDTTTVWLGDTANAAGLRAFLAAVESGARCLALTEVS